MWIVSENYILKRVKLIDLMYPYDQMYNIFVRLCKDSLFAISSLYMINVHIKQHSVS